MGTPHPSTDLDLELSLPVDGPMDVTRPISLSPMMWQGLTGYAAHLRKQDQHGLLLHYQRVWLDQWREYLHQERSRALEHELAYRTREKDGTDE